MSRIQNLDTPALVSGDMQTMQTIARHPARADRNYRPGDRIRVLASHVSTAMNLHQRVSAVRGDEVVTGWKIEARGKPRQP